MDWMNKASFNWTKKSKNDRGQEFRILSTLSIHRMMVKINLQKSNTLMQFSCTSKNFIRSILHLHKSCHFYNQWFMKCLEVLLIHYLNGPYSTSSGFIVVLNEVKNDNDLLKGGENQFRCHHVAWVLYNSFLLILKFHKSFHFTIKQLRNVWK